MKWIQSVILAMAMIFAVFTVVGSQSGTPDKAQGEKGPATPLQSLEIYLDAFHFHNGDLTRQMEVHHFCGPLDSGVIQCALFDGREPGARLIGIEYVIGEALFKSLPEEEKRFWHSHVYEVKSGQLISPNLTDAEEHDLMKTLVSTYGKTWHTWSTDHLDDKLPIGVPSLMMGFTADGQADPALVERRDRRFGISTEGKKKARGQMEAPPVLPGADAWQTGRGLQLEEKEAPMKTGR